MDSLTIRPGVDSANERTNERTNERAAGESLSCTVREVKPPSIHTYQSNKAAGQTEIDSRLFTKKKEMKKELIRAERHVNHRSSSFCFAAPAVVVSPNLHKALPPPLAPTKPPSYVLILHHPAPWSASAHEHPSTRQSMLRALAANFLVLRVRLSPPVLCWCWCYRDRRSDTNKPKTTTARFSFPACLGMDVSISNTATKHTPGKHVPSP